MRCRLKLWEDAVGLQLDKSYYTHLCSSHFDDSDMDAAYLFKKNALPLNPGRPKLRGDAVPHLNIPLAGMFIKFFIKYVIPFYYCYSKTMIYDVVALIYNLM
jgi:hypothetical protein